MTSQLLVLNTGSSSVKFQVFRPEEAGLVRVAKGLLGGLNSRPHLKIVDAVGETTVDEDLERERVDLGAAIDRTLDEVERAIGQDDLLAVGHRVVHGGKHFTAPAMIDQNSLAAIEALIPLAPLHQPASIAPMHKVRERWPDLAQVACFDTVFHAGHADLIDRFAIPAALDAQGIRRYGFHGLSYAYIADELRRIDPALARGRMIVAHLGSGASLCALQEGRSVETTMGFTALDGVPMGTRPGRLDPGVLLYLMQQGWDAGQVEDMLYHESGLRALSGISADVRDLEASSDERAAFALDYFAHRIAQEAAALVTTLGGIDGLVFTAGIGERSARVRARVAEWLSWLGMRLDETANAENAELISATNSRFAVRVMPTNEELMIARQTLEVLGRHRPR